MAEILLRIDESTLIALNETAVRQRRTRTEVIRHAISQYLKRLEREK